MKKRKLLWPLIIIIISSLATVVYFRKTVLISDPYWNTVINWHTWQQRGAALLYGRWLTINSFKDWSAVPPVLESNRKKKIKSILTPYWRSDVLATENEFSLDDSALLLSPAASDQAAINLVSIDQENLYRLLGQLLLGYIQQDDKRNKVVAYFYAGDSYDPYAFAFSAAFAAEDQSLLELQRFYTSQWAKIQEQLENLASDRVVLVMALSELNHRALQLFEENNDLLFVSEDNRFPAYLQGRMLLSIEKDYRQLLRSALAGRSSSSGYLYLPDSSPLATLLPKQHLIKRDSKLLTWLAYFWS